MEAKRNVGMQDLTTPRMIYKYVAASMARMTAEQDEEERQKAEETREPGAEASDEPMDPETVTKERFLALVQRAHSDPEARQEVRMIFDARPDVFAYVGDIALRAEELWIARGGRTGTPGFEGNMYRLEQMRAELAGPSPTPLVELAARRVSQCWLHAQYIDCEAATPGLSNKEVAFWSRQQDQANKRYTSAMRSLKLAKEVAMAEAAAEASQASSSTAKTTSSSANGKGSVNGQSSGSDVAGSGSGTPLHRFARHLAPLVA